MTQLLAIDDDRELTTLLTELLAADGLTVTAASTASEGLLRLEQEFYALVLLDVMLPDLDGFATLRKLRQRSSVPVLMLTARGETEDRITGLENGADDYLAKPFHFRELKARIQALLRRASRADGPLPSPATSPSEVTVGDLRLDPQSRRVLRQGVRVELTSTEFDVLWQLLDAAGSAVEREVLTQSVLGRAHNPLDRSIDNLVSILRRKLGPAPDGSDRILTIRHIGYQYARWRG